MVAAVIETDSMALLNSQGTQVASFLSSIEAAVSRQLKRNFTSTAFDSEIGRKRQSRCNATSCLQAIFPVSKMEKLCPSALLAFAKAGHSLATMRQQLASTQRQQQEVAQLVERVEMQAAFHALPWIGHALVHQLWRHSAPLAKPAGHATAVGWRCGI
jgi:hypothetical protein